MPIRRTGLAALAAAVLYWATGSAVPAAAEPVRPLVLAFDVMLPWKSLVDGVYGGAYTEIARELARRAGQPLEIRECPLKRCLFMLERGDADIIIGLRNTPERQRYLQFLRTPYRDRSSDKVFYVQEGRSASIRGYADLAPLRIGTKLGAEYLPRFDQDASLNKDAVKDMEINFRKLAMGRLDAVLIPEDQGEALLARLQLEGHIDKAAYRIPDPSPRAVAVARNSAAMANIAALERAMSEMARDGTLAAIYKRYYYDAYQVAPTRVQIK
jgi:polar amino acid transport system substrate-binding protein